ncbi:tripartite tricarboxylate transporter TctB family protein [Alkalicoccus chagannorensis]|uniref:tripartite tricarboxylate transporter TctB family protein n=1 Tax=Alkalicoccus chagannorensis TaxID=427072 RepID=UPI00042091A7|nr:tripartite tricarboxylate transporter TctB family protein [Alkalicoccus chagannorensis]
MRSSIVIGIISIIFAAAAWTMTTDLPPESALFPRLILGSMGVVGLLMTIDGARKLRTENIEDEEPGLTKNIVIFQLVIPGAIMLFAYGLLHLAGFFITAFVVINILYYYQRYRMLEALPSGRDALTGVILSGSVTLVTYLVFSVLLGLPTPSGEWF